MTALKDRSDPDFAPISARLVPPDSPEQVPVSPESGLLRRFWKRVWGWTRWSVGSTFCLASLVGILAVVTAIPVLQILSLGYMLSVAGGLASGKPFRRALPGLQAAGKIGGIALTLGLASLPTRLLNHWESVAAIIEPGSPTADNLRVGAFALSIALTIHLWWAWIRGGRFRHYVWPEPKRFLREAWRPSLWSRTSENIWQFLWSLRVPRIASLGFRGVIGTLIWLIPAFLIIVMTRDGRDGVAGLLAAIAFLALAIVLMYLPMLQTHFAAENRFAALFELRRVRRDFVYAPWSWAAAMLVGLVLMPIPLYLLRVEATPQEITWLPCLVFVAFMLPARIAEGLALRRCRRLRRESESGVRVFGWWGRSRLGQFWTRISPWVVRLVIMPTIIVVYLAVLTISPYTSWDGADAWVRQHALLVPVPFVGI